MTYPYIQLPRSSSIEVQPAFPRQVDDPFSLPAEAAVADLLVIPPGFATQLLRLPLAEGRTEDLILTGEPERGSLTLLAGDSKETYQNGLSALQYEDATSWPIDLFPPLLLLLEKLAFREDGMVLTDMAVGRYSFCTESAGKRPVCSAGFLPPGGDLVLGSEGWE